MRFPGGSGRIAAVLLGALLLGVAPLGVPQAASAMTGGNAPAVGGPVIRALPLPQPGDGDLQGIFCTSSVSCWAVGFFVTGGETQLNEVLRWNGSAWSQVGVPSPGGTADGDSSHLYAVRCTSPRNCWAVGDYQRLEGARFSQALHWNGRTWSLVPTPQPGGTAGGSFSSLFDVVCWSAASCWAVGADGTLGSARPVERNEALHWNGRKWALVPTPDPGGTAANDANVLDGVRCPAARSCLAVGGTGKVISTTGAGLNEVLRWNGRKWLKAAVPSPGGPPDHGGFSELLSLTCTSPTNCWAAGADGAFGSTVLSQLLRWNGRRWSQASIPEPGGTSGPATQQLSAVTCSSAANCWAVGSYIPSGGETVSTLNEAIHWDGASWTLVVTPDPGGFDASDISELNAVRCTSRTSCWAVGLAGQSGATVGNQALHWDGVSWAADKAAVQ